MHEFPKTLYRPAAAGGLEHRSFANPDAIPKGEGWTDYNSAKAEAKPAPAPETRTQRDAAKADKQIAEITAKANKLETTLIAEKAASQETRAELGLAMGRITELEDFLRGLARDQSAPAELRASINDLLEPPPVKAAKAAKAAAAKRAEKAA